MALTHICGPSYSLACASFVALQLSSLHSLLLLLHISRSDLTVKKPVATNSTNRMHHTPVLKYIKYVVVNNVQYENAALRVLLVGIPQTNVYNPIEHFGNLYFVEEGCYVKKHNHGHQLK